MDGLTIMQEPDKRKLMAQLFEQRRGLIEQLKRTRARKSELLEELDQLASRLEDERQQYKELKARLNALNQDRKSLTDEIRKAKERHKEATTQLEDMKPALRSRGEELQKELKRMEWKLQTEHLSKEEEKGLLEKMKELAYTLSVWKKAYHLKDEAMKLGRDLDEKSAALFDIKADRQETIKMISEKRQKIDEYTKAGRQVYDEIEGTEQDIKELEKKLHKVDSELKELRAEIDKEMQEERKLKWEARVSANKEALEKARKEAMERIKKGEALSLNDLKLLYDEDSVN